MVFRLTQLFYACLGLLVSVMFAAAMIIVNYLMMVEALKLFFDRTSLAEDPLWGPLVRWAGVGDVQLHHLWATMLAVGVTLGLTFLVHQIRDLSRDGAEPVTRERWFVLVGFGVCTLVLLNFDFTAFGFRLSQHLFCDEFDEAAKLPDFWALLQLKSGLYVTALLLAGSAAYLALSGLVALALDTTWVRVQQTLEDFLEYFQPEEDDLYDEDVDDATPQGDAPAAHIDPDRQVRVDGAPGLYVTHPEAQAQPDRYHICQCGQISLPEHWKVYGCSQCLANGRPPVAGAAR